MTGNHWTSEHRRKQAEALRQWQPWRQSTGPRTKAGKAASNRNGWKGGTRPMLRALAKALRKQREWVRNS